MKKILIIILSVVFCMVLVSCDNDNFNEETIALNNVIDESVIDTTTTNEDSTKPIENNNTDSNDSKESAAQDNWTNNY